MEEAIRILFQISYMGSMAWMIWLLLERYFRLRRHRIRHRFRQRIEGSHSSRLWIFRHLDKLLFLTAKDFQSGISSFRFLMRCLYLFLATFLTLLLVGEYPTFMSSNPFVDSNIVMTDISWTAMGIISLVVGFLPYIFLRFRYHRNVVKSSYDLADVIKIMSRHAHFAISPALRRTADDLPASNVLRRPLYILSDLFSSYSSHEELQAEALRFSSSIGTTFAMQFIMDLLSFEKDGIKNLKTSLLFLNETMELQRQAILKVKEQNQDAISLGLWVNAFVILLVSGFGVYYLTPNVFFKLLFQTNLGLYLLVFMLFSFVLSFLVSLLLSRPKLDY